MYTVLPMAFAGWSFDFHPGPKTSNVIALLLILLPVAFVVGFAVFVVWHVLRLTRLFLEWRKGGAGSGLFPGIPVSVPAQTGTELLDLIRLANNQRVTAAAQARTWRLAMAIVFPVLVLLFLFSPTAQTIIGFSPFVLACAIVWYIWRARVRSSSRAGTALQGQTAGRRAGNLSAGAGIAARTTQIPRRLIWFLLLPPVPFVWTAIGLPGVRSLAAQYASTPDCKIENLIGKPAASAAAPIASGEETAICEIRLMTVLDKPSSHGRDLVRLQDAGRRQYEPELPDSLFWEHLDQGTVVNAQLAGGHVAAIAHLAEVARTGDHPEILLRSMYHRLLIFGMLAAFPMSLATWALRRARRRVRALGGMSLNGQSYPML